MSTIIDQYREKLDAGKAVTESEWSSLVSKLANEANVTETEIVAVMQSSGRTLDELEQAVKVKKREVELRKLVEQYPAAMRKSQTAEAEKTAYHLRRQKSWADFQAEDKLIHAACYEAQCDVVSIRAAVGELEELIGEQITLPMIPDLEPPDTPATIGRKAKRA
ncbi:MAG: hypothetical protein NT013_13800 [Planctomycetia bacterium]|nr:hypothetical protein [Planctomycetia bacterium]